MDHYLEGHAWLQKKKQHRQHLSLQLQLAHLGDPSIWCVFVLKNIINNMSKGF
jgi:hypothetical protein